MIPRVTFPIFYGKKLNTFTVKYSKANVTRRVYLTIENAHWIQEYNLYNITTENRRNLADSRELNKADVQTAVQGMARLLFAGMTMAGVGFAYFGFSISHPILKSG